MAYALMHDGSKKQLDYNQAAKIRAILEGNKEPESPEQEAFCMNVQTVIFDKAPDTYEVEALKEPDPVLHTILSDYTKTGYDKFVAVGRRLKERTSQV